MGITILNCQNIEFSPELSEKRINKAMIVIALPILRRLLAFTLYLLGAKFNDIGKSLGYSVNSLKTMFSSLQKDGLIALEDRRKKRDTKGTETQNLKGLGYIKNVNGFFEVKIPDSDFLIKIPTENSVQQRAVLLTLKNAGAFSTSEVGNALNITSSRVRELCKKIESNDIDGIIDKRCGQLTDYKINPEIKAQLIQQFATHAVIHKSTSSISLTKELNKEMDIHRSDRTVREHIKKLGLKLISKSLPELIENSKKNSSQ